jgi:hypothetical protein
LTEYDKNIIIFHRSKPMQTIHKVVKVINNQVIIDMPPDFMANEVEVILKPLTHKAPGIHELEKEIDIGMKSPFSPRSHEEIFNKLKEKYAPR